MTLRGLILWGILCGTIGVFVTKFYDRQEIRHAQHNEMQAQGLEDECKAQLERK